MRSWRLLLGGLIVWAAHFFALYIVASLFPGRGLAAWLVLAATAIALAATIWLLLRAFKALRSGGDELDSWLGGAGILGCALALVAILYQGLPAALG